MSGLGFGQYYVSMLSDIQSPDLDSPVVLCVSESALSGLGPNSDVKVHVVGRHIMHDAGGKIREARRMFISPFFLPFFWAM